MGVRVNRAQIKLRTKQACVFLQKRERIENAVRFSLFFFPIQFFMFASQHFSTILV